MKTFQRIVAATEQEHRSCIETNPLLQLVAAGQMSRQHYIAYLCETYHLVRHTSRMLALGGARLTDDKRGVRNWFFEQVMEENGHDLFCIKDLQHLDEEPQTILDFTARAGCLGHDHPELFYGDLRQPRGHSRGCYRNRRFGGAIWNRIRRHFG